MEYFSSTPSLLFLSAAWIVWVAFMFCLAIARVAKTKPEQAPTHVGGILPFKSREEFLKARMEMDLGEFLDRAYVTPKEITRWKRPEIITAQGPVLPSPNGRVPKDIAGIAGSAQIGQQLGWGSPGGCGGFPSVGGVGGAAGTMFQGSGTPKFIDVTYNVISDKFSSGQLQGPYVAAPLLTAPLKEGCWYRRKCNGELVRCQRSFITAGYFITKAGIIVPCHDHEVKIAIPRAGETWTMNPCNEHLGGPHSPNNYTVQSFHPAIQAGVSDIWEKFTLCGCSVPFEFGHGKI